MDSWGACVQISLEVTATSLEEVHWEEREGFGLQGALCGEKRTGLEVSGQFQCSPSFATNVMCVTSGKQSILQASSFSSQYEGVRLTSKTLTSSYLPWLPNLLISAPSWLFHNQDVRMPKPVTRPGRYIFVPCKFQIIQKIIWNYFGSSWSNGTKGNVGGKKSYLGQKILIIPRLSPNIENESDWGKGCQRLGHFPRASLQCHGEVGWWPMAEITADTPKNNKYLYLIAVNTFFQLAASVSFSK